MFIDESGDTGFKEASSRFFIITMVVFPDEDKEGRYPMAEQTSLTIEKTQQETRHKTEFHFSQCSHKVRHSFFQDLNTANCDFRIYTLVVDKKKIHSTHLKGNTKNFYNFILKQLLTHNPIQGARIKIDGEKGKAFRQALKTYLRTGKNGVVNKLKFANSKNDRLVQLADMACGAIAYSFNRGDKLESDMYKKQLGKRIMNIWEFK